MYERRGPQRNKKVKQGYISELQFKKEGSWLLPSPPVGMNAKLTPDMLENGQSLSGFEEVWRLAFQMQVSIPFRNQRMAKCKRWLLACFGIFLLKNITEFPNPRIFSYSTTNKSSACSQEKGSKVKNVADNKDGEARSTETVLANYSTTMYQLTISSN